MKKTAQIPAAALVLALLGGCGGEPQPVPTVTGEATVTTTARATVTVTATATPVEKTTGDPTVLDVSTDEGLCAADAELTNLELNNALAPPLGYPADRDLRTFDQDEAIRAHKNAALGRTCPERAS